MKNGNDRKAAKSANQPARVIRIGTIKAEIWANPFVRPTGRASSE